MTYSLLSVLDQVSSDSVDFRMRQIRSRLLRIVCSVCVGSGLLITEDGYALTACHVVDKDLEYRAYLNGFDPSFGLSVCAFSREEDVALVRLDLCASDDACPVYFSKSEKGSLCSLSIANGSLEYKFGDYCSTGKRLKTTIPAVPGWSGSPVVRDGYVLGILTNAPEDASYSIAARFEAIEDLILNYVTESARDSA